MPIFTKQSSGKYHRFLPLICGSILLFSNTSQASIINMDFASGFDSWQGEIIDETNTYSEVDPVLYPERFELSGDAVTLSTGFSGNSEIWSVLLFQEFTFGPLTLGNDTLYLSFELLKNLTDPDPLAGDFYFVYLRDLDTNDIMDLSSGGTFDVTNWIGINASFEFGVQDFDFTHPDSITLSNLNVRQNGSNIDVPAPASVVWYVVLCLFLIRKINTVKR